MSLLNIFKQKTTDITLERLNKITNATKPLWGKMDAGQMLAHLNIAYHTANGSLDLKKDSWFTKLMMRAFVKNVVVSDKPYKKNNRTAPHFIVTLPQNFQLEKALLIKNIKEVQEKGASHFEGKDSHSFGPLTEKEWSNLFYKHLDHHFQQFGV